MKTDDLNGKHKKPDEHGEGPSSVYKPVKWHVWYDTRNYHVIVAPNITIAQAKFIDQYGMMPVYITPGTDDKGRPNPPPGYTYVEDNEDE